MKLTFHKGYSETNQHGTERKGDPWNKQTVKGWKLKVVKLETFVRVAGWDDAWIVQSLAGRRLIVYRPSGAWWHFDVCLSMTKSRENA